MPPETAKKITGEHGLGWERPKFQGGLKYPGGYTGAILTEPDPVHILDIKMKRVACLGYSAFRPGKKDIVGAPLVSLAAERGEGEADNDPSKYKERFAAAMEEKKDDTDPDDFRESWKNVDIQERYANAKRQIIRRGQSEKMLIQIVQSKLGGRVNSYAEQQIKVRKLFESFDTNG